MKITVNLLRQFIGGIMEIRNPKDRYAYRGLVEEIKPDGDMIRFQFSWQEVNEGNQTSPEKWRKSKSNKYLINPDLFKVTNYNGKLTMECASTSDHIQLSLAS